MNTDQYRGKIKAICISDKRGVAKHPVNEAMFVKDHGIEGDAHAGSWHRQVSLLGASVIAEFNEKGGSVSDGDFGENLIIEGIDVSSLGVGTQIVIGKEDTAVRLCITQKGKECHSHCEIFKRTGDCIMPREGVFAEVTKGGRVSVDDEVKIIAPDSKRPFTAAVIVLSDKASQGIRQDESGPAAVQVLEDDGYIVTEQILIPDDSKKLKSELIRLSDQRQTDLIVTSGGTGFSMRDTTPEATMEVAHRNAPGIAEYMRARSAGITDRAMFSRGVSVIRGRSIIVNLPGSPKAVRECLGFILGALRHGIGILRGDEGECGRRS